MENINSGWEFQKLPDVNIDEMSEKPFFPIGKDGFERIDLPHTWYKDGESYKGTALYKKRLLLSCGSKKRVFLNFEAAERWCEVFVNGHYAGGHKGGYSAFTFEITKFCDLDGYNDLCVFVDNRSWDMISPLAGDFTIFGGLYRDVNLIVTEETCFDRTYYGTSGVIVCADLSSDGAGRIQAETHVLSMDDKPVTQLFKVFGPDNQQVFESEVPFSEKNDIYIENPVLWEGMGKAALYRLHTELCVDGKTKDSLDICFGFRSVSIDSEKGFFLNGQHIKINGVAKHQDYGEVFNAVGMEQWNQDISDILDLGANSVRLSHYQHPQPMYRLCDENGLIVWAEIPMLKMTKDIGGFENACLQLKELILQNMHHPSICFWGIQNEIAMFSEQEWMYEKLRNMNDLVKTLDSTRISACANLFCVKNESPLNQITEAVGYNIYFGWYYGDMKDSEDFVDQFHKDNPHLALGITEYGADCNLAYHSECPKVKDYSEEFQALYHESVYPVFRERDYLWGTYVWNLYDFSSEIRDEGGVKFKNCKGLISYDRKIKKDAFYYYKSQWSDLPFVKIGESRFVNRLNPEMTVKVYSNQKEVSVYVNGEVFTQSSENGIFLFKNVCLKNGENTVKAVSGNCMDTAVFQKTEQQDSSYIFIDPNPGLNVRNWFLDETEEAEMFPENRFSIRDSCAAILENDQAMSVIKEFLPELAKQMNERQSPMPLDRILNHMKKDISEEQCKLLNQKLTKIEKVL